MAGKRPGERGWQEVCANARAPHGGEALILIQGTHETQGSFVWLLNPGHSVAAGRRGQAVGRKGRCARDGETSTGFAPES